MNTFEDHQTPRAAPSSPPPEAQARDLEPAAEDARAAESGAGGETVGDASLDHRIIAALREVYDPEIPVNIYDLGLIYRIDCDDMGVVEIDMTLTAPGCPVAQTFPGTVEAAVQNVEGVAAAEVDLVWEPPWTPDRMSEAAKLELGFF
jgi:FeS assembly SUF system protein